MAKRTPEQLRKRRHLSLRNKVAGTADRPRLVVHRSNQGVEAQIVDDRAHKTLASASWLDKDIKSAPRAERPAKVGKPQVGKVSRSPVMVGKRESAKVGKPNSRIAPAA